MMLNSVSRFTFYLDASISIKCQSNIFRGDCSSRPACSITTTSLFFYSFVKVSQQVCV